MSDAEVYACVTACAGAANPLPGELARWREIGRYLHDMNMDSFRDTFSHTSGHNTEWCCPLCGTTFPDEHDECPMPDVLKLLQEVDGE